MNRNGRDWPAVRLAVDARMEELGLSTAEVAQKMRMAESTLRAFLKGQTMPHGITVRCINDALGLPSNHLSAIADRRNPEPPPPTRETSPEPPPPAREASNGTPVVALLSLTDLAPGAQMVAEYRAYVLMVAKEIQEGMTREQRLNTGKFLGDIAVEVRWG